MTFAHAPCGTREAIFECAARLYPGEPTTAALPGAFVSTCRDAGWDPIGQCVWHATGPLPLTWEAFARMNC